MDKTEQPISVTAYIKIGKTPKGYKVSASSKPDYTPIKGNNFGKTVFYPTINFLAEFQISPKSFDLAKAEAIRINVMETLVRPNGRVI